MTNPPHLWLRHEHRATERRTPIVPEDARRLVAGGARLTVEDSPQRVFPLSAYEEAGCRTAEAGSWTRAPRENVVIGLKELPAEPASLTHRHVFFGHAYKGQPGAEELLGRFAAGGGALLDLEYLVDEDGRRLAAFGYWAGYVGAALAVLRAAGLLDAPLRSMARDALDERLRAAAASPAPAPRALVVGALGRCGQGAADALETGGAVVTRWDMAETRRLDKDALVGHDILVNAVLTTRPAPAFLTPEDLDREDRRLSVVCDVTCDVASPFNLLPVYDTTTTWEEPVRTLREGRVPLDLIAIDNLPSLLPEEASTDFSAALSPHLLSLAGGAAWQRCLDRFHEFSARLTRQETAHA